MLGMLVPQACGQHAGDRK